MGVKGVGVPVNRNSSLSRFLDRHPAEPAEASISVQVLHQSVCRHPIAKNKMPAATYTTTSKIHHQQHTPPPATYTTKYITSNIHHQIHHQQHTPGLAVVHTIGSVTHGASEQAIERGSEAARQRGASQNSYRTTEGNPNTCSRFASSQSLQV